MKLKSILCYIAFLTITHFSYAQNDDIRVKNYMWSTDADFKTIKCDDQWKNESAVILCRKYEYQVKKMFIINNITQNTYTRTRILLKDKVSVDNFSTFSIDVSKHTGYYFGMGENNKIYCGIKIIKPNGKETEVSIDKNLIDELKSKSESSQTQKIAIPNLEVGDIIDYYLVCESTISGNYSYFGFNPVLYCLSAEYPIQKQVINMNIMRKCYLSVRSMNNAPELKREKLGEKEIQVWSLTDSNRPKAKEQQYCYSRRELPILAFQAHYVRKNDSNDESYFIDKEDKIKSEITNANYLTYLKNIENYETRRYDAKIVVKLFNKKYKNEKNETVIAKELYNICRDYTYNETFAYKLANGENVNSNYNEFNFNNLFAWALQLKKIDFSYLVTIPRELGDIKDVVMRAQMGYLLRVNTEKPLYFTNPTPYTHFPDIDYSYEGCKAKYMTSGKKTERKVNEITIPVSESKQNSFLQTMNVSFDAMYAEKLVIQQEINASGLQKEAYQWKFITIGERKKEIEKNPYNINPVKVILGKSHKRIEEIINNDENQRESRVVEYLKDDLEVENITNKHSEVVQTGMETDKPNFIFNNTFEINHFITKTGNTIILEVGKLIGDQLVPNVSDSIRLYNIYTAYARTIEYKINIDIPKNYKVKGVNNLTSNVSNETGSFSSSAKIENNKIVISVKKIYANNYFDKSKWPLMSSFLTATVDFRNQKIMFSPEK